MPREWMKRLREAKGLTIEEAARACSQPEATVSVRLLEYLEDWDSWTQAVFTRQIAQVYGMTPEEEKEITRDYVYDEKLGRIRLRDSPPPPAEGRGMKKEKTGEKRRKRKAAWQLEVRRVIERLAALNLSMRECSKRAEKCEDWASNLIRNGGEGGTIQMRTAQLLAQVLQCDVFEIIRPTDKGGDQ
ncbi:MAG: hypothetical protein IJF65_04620 [Clostridia bacterium]|nr:hypothetical protein [Clostridia bacterium]